MKTYLLFSFLIISHQSISQTTTLYPFSPNGKTWGLVNDSIKIIIKPLYDQEFNFYDRPVTTMILNKKTGIIDKNGKIILHCAYDNISFGNHEEAVVTLQKKTGIASSKTGKILLPLVYDEVNINHSIQNVIKIRKNNKWGIVNTISWKEVGKIEFDEVKDNSNIMNTAIVKKQLKYGMINTRTGIMLLPTSYDEISYKYDNNIQKYFVSAYSNGVTKKFDGNGKLLKEEKKEKSSLDVDKISVVTEDRAPQNYYNKPVSSDYKNLYLYKTGDKTWKVTIEKREAAGNTELFESFEIEGYDTIIKLENNASFDPPFDRYKLKVKKEGKVGIINLKGDVLVNIIFDDIDNFEGERYKTKINGLYGLLHKTSLKEIKKPIIKRITSYSYNGLYEIEMPAGQIGYMNAETGKIYIPSVE